MTEPARDMWAEWLLERRHGGDPEDLEATLDYLYPVRNRVLDNAGIGEGDVVLDVGTGENAETGLLQPFAQPQVEPFFGLGEERTREVDQHLPPLLHGEQGSMPSR
jgi:hypothetical protein